MLMKVSSGIKCSVLSVNINSVPMFLLQCWWWEVEDDQVVGCGWSYGDDGACDGDKKETEFSVKRMACSRSGADC